MYDLIIVGAGAFAREVRQFVPHSFPYRSVKMKGFLSNNPQDSEKFSLPEPILGDPEQYLPEQNDRFLLAIGDIRDRRRITHVLKSRDAKFLTLIHPTAFIDSTAELGEGCIIYPFATIMNEARIEDFVMMNIYSSAGHDTQIGQYCNLSPYATMNGFSVLDDDVFLGTHASVLAYNRVGRGSKVSANSVVTQNVGPSTLVFGVPGRHMPLISHRG
ncbi:MAG TPA: acetyltransferase [Pirellulales bacterium]|jgi:sugar O-acyltransferase (sialic acid O-acetyltransferase NeuD family)|nr:acetyltransferase [Pirellulales bacterium]